MKFHYMVVWTYPFNKGFQRQFCLILNKLHFMFLYYNRFVTEKLFPWFHIYFNRSWPLTLTDPNYTPELVCFNKWSLVDIFISTCWPMLKLGTGQSSQSDKMSVYSHALDDPNVVIIVVKTCLLHTPKSVNKDFKKVNSSSIGLSIYVCAIWRIHFLFKKIKRIYLRLVKK